MIYGWDPDRPFPTGSAGDLAASTASYMRECMQPQDFLRWAKAEREADLTGALHSLSMPTLVAIYSFGGRLHPFTPRDAARRLAAIIPSAQMVVVNGLDMILDRVEEFLQSV